MFVCSRLLEELIEKEREYQAILQQVLEEREQEIKLLKCRSGPVGESDLRIYTHIHGHTQYSELQTAMKMPANTEAVKYQLTDNLSFNHFVPLLLKFPQCSLKLRVFLH